MICCAALAIVAGCGERTPKTPEVVLDQWVGEGKTRLLVDGIHQLEGIPDAIWDEDEHRYAHSQSMSRLFNSLIRQHDWRYRQVRDGRLSLELLRAHDVLYMNVPTELDIGSSKTDRKMPRLSDGEVQALLTWMKEGGGLFIVGEHNNVYNHNVVLKPLFEPLGIEQVDSYASELGRGRYAMDVGGYIIMFRHFKEHFITGGVRMLSWSGGGTFTPESKGGVAFLSETGFSDLGNYVTKKPAKYSNHRVDEGEYQGPDIPLIIAQQVGKGRLVVIGDHNMLGVSWLGVGDNYLFGVNAMQWLAQREGEKPFRETPPHGIRFGLEQEIAGWSLGRRDKVGFYGFFYDLSRRPDIFPMGLMDLEDEAEIYGFLEPDVIYDEAELAKVDRALDAGKRVFVLTDAAAPSKGAAQLLARYAPGARLVGPGGSVTFGELEAGVNELFPRMEGAFLPLASDDIDVRGGKIAALWHGPKGYTRGGKSRDARPKDYRKGKPYVLDVKVEGGEPLVWAKLPDGRESTIISRFPARKGELMVMVQGKIFSNHTKHCIREEPVSTNLPAHDLQMRWMDWLATNPPITTAPAAAPPTASADTPDAGTPEE